VVALETSSNTIDWAGTVGLMGANGDQSVLLFCFCTAHHPALSKFAQEVLFLSGMPPDLQQALACKLDYAESS
jgi:hypothetical protein